MTFCTELKNKYVIAITEKESLEFVERFKDSKPKQKDLQDFVEEKGLNEEDIKDLMYDLNKHGIRNLEKPKPSSKPAKKAFTKIVVTPELVKKTAKEFARVLHTWLTAEEMKKVVEDNRGESKSICHSHDFCDANMAMDEAFTNLGLTMWDENDDGLSDEGTDLANAAWSLAKEKEFDISKI